MIVRRHINWNNQRPDLKEDLAHLVQDIKRRICGVASAGFPLINLPKLEKFLETKYRKNL